MEIRENDTLCVIAPIQNELSDYKVKRIIDRINRETRKVSIDLSKTDASDYVEEKFKLA